MLAGGLHTYRTKSGSSAVGAKRLSSFIPIATFSLRVTTSLHLFKCVLQKDLSSTMSHAAPASQSTQSPAAQQQSPPQQQLPASAAGASKPKQSTTGWVTSLWRSYGNKYIIPTIKYIVALAFTIAAFVYVPKGYKAAIQSYKATNLSNELSQKESCRAHPVRT